jgi:hypothetical protein
VSEQNAPQEDRSPDQNVEVYDQEGNRAGVAESAEERAVDQREAQQASDEQMELEFNERIRPVLNELQNRMTELADLGDEAGLMHTRFCYDVITQRFRIPSSEHLAENAQDFGNLSEQSAGEGTVGTAAPENPSEMNRDPELEQPREEDVIHEGESYPEPKEEPDRTQAEQADGSTQEGDRQQ